MNAEIYEFYDYVTPFQHESDIRSRVVDRVQDVLRRANNVPSSRDVQVLAFGSYACGLYLPTADMDLVAVSPQFQARGRVTYAKSARDVYKLSGHFVKSGLCLDNVSVPIPHARVPIIKFAEKRSGIKVDISFENASGLHANGTFERWKEQFPHMPILVMLVKQLLNMRGLNEVPTGGIGGFTTICLVVSMLQHMPPRQLETSSMADLLLDFLSLYGSKFDFRRTGIRMEPPGLFDKRSARSQVRCKINMERLTIIDPNLETNDIAGGSKNIADVFRIFRDAHDALRERTAEVRGNRSDQNSILGCILGGNYRSFDDARRNLLQVSGQPSSRMAQILPPSPLPRESQEGHPDYRSIPPPAQYSRQASDPRFQQGYPQYSDGQRFNPINTMQHTNLQSNFSTSPPQHLAQAPPMQPGSAGSQPNQQMYGTPLPWNAPSAWNLDGGYSYGRPY